MHGIESPLTCRQSVESVDLAPSAPWNSPPQSTSILDCVTLLKGSCSQPDDSHMLHNSLFVKMQSPPAPDTRSCTIDPVRNTHIRPLSSSIASSAFGGGNVESNAAEAGGKYAAGADIAALNSDRSTATTEPRRRPGPQARRHDSDLSAGAVSFCDAVPADAARLPAPPPRFAPAQLAASPTALQPKLPTPPPPPPPATWAAAHLLDVDPFRNDWPHW